MALATAPTLLRSNVTRKVCEKCLDVAASLEVELLLIASLLWLALGRLIRELLAETAVDVDAAIDFTRQLASGAVDQGLRLGLMLRLKLGQSQRVGILFTYCARMIRISGTPSAEKQGARTTDRTSVAHGVARVQANSASKTWIGNWSVKDRTEMTWNGVNRARKGLGVRDRAVKDLAVE